MTEMSAERERLLKNINEELGLTGDEAMSFEMLEANKTSPERVKKFKKMLKDLRSFGHTKKHSL